MYFNHSQVKLKNKNWADPFLDVIFQKNDHGKQAQMKTI